MGLQTQQVAAKSYAQCLEIAPQFIGKRAHSVREANQRWPDDDGEEDDGVRPRRFRKAAAAASESAEKECKANLGNRKRNYRTVWKPTEALPVDLLAKLPLSRAVSHLL